MTKVSQSHKVKYIRKIRLFSWRIGIFRLFIEKHEWVDRNQPFYKRLSFFQKFQFRKEIQSLKKGFKKGRK